MDNSTPISIPAVIDALAQIDAGTFGGNRLDLASDLRVLAGRIEDTQPGQ